MFLKSQNKGKYRRRGGRKYLPCIGRGFGWDAGVGVSFGSDEGVGAD